MTDAFSTADTIVADMGGQHALLNSPGRSTGLGWEGIRAEAEKRGLRTTSWSDWEKIDAVEQKMGKEKGKLREKFGRVEEMLKVIE